jgi:hypothetical protein
MIEVSNMRLSTDKIMLVNRLYGKYNSFSKVAELTGLSEFQVQHYIIKNLPADEIHIKTENLPQFRVGDYLEKDLKEMCSLTNDEVKNILLIWEMCDA